MKFFIAWIKFSKGGGSKMAIEMSIFEERHICKKEGNGKNEYCQQPVKSFKKVTEIIY